MARRDGGRAAILPRHGVYAFGYPGAADSPGFEGADLRRFARLFADALRRVPLGTRRRILAHWRAGRSLLEGGPWIQVSPAPFVPSQVFAQVMAPGHWLKFGAFVRRMPDGVVGDLIAHELGHVEQYALGLWPEPGAVRGRRFRDLCSRMERDADRRIVEWGFDPTSIFAWAIADGVPEFAGVPRSGRLLRGWSGRGEATPRE